MDPQPEAAPSTERAAPWPVMVLAHNEERRIAACLDSIYAAEAGRKLDVFVMANGCTDRTADIVENYARGQQGLHLVPIALGDKCNAWNVFVHDTVPAHCPGREIYFFVNGDARVVPGSFGAMARALRDDAYAHAASALPASGRNAVRDRRTILEVRGLVANLYALRGRFVERLRSEAIRLPLNFECDDGLIGALVKWDLAPERGAPEDARIVPCADAEFEFESMSPLRPADWKAYCRRSIRYGRRHYEFQLLGPLLKAKGITGLPADITDLYAGSGALRLRWQGLYTLTNWIALRQLREHRKAKR